MKRTLIRLFAILVLAVVAFLIYQDNKLTQDLMYKMDELTIVDPTNLRTIATMNLDEVNTFTFCKWLADFMTENPNIIFVLHISYWTVSLVFSGSHSTCMIVF